MELVTKCNAPLDVHFNAAVMTIANRLFPTGYDVADVAPDTLEKLTDHIAKTGRMLVFKGGSDHTIFGCPEHNWAFRAWHDWHHWKHQLPFTPQGESAVAKHQMLDLVTVFGHSADVAQWCKYIDAEVNGQIEYSELHNGQFPENQMAFVLAFMRHPDQAVLETF